MGIKEEWTFQVTDVKKIPREYLMPDEKKIKGVIKIGVHEIAGLRIYSQPKSSVRNK